MRTLRRASLGYLLRHPWQLGLALLGIGIGVAVIVAVDLATASAGRAFRLSMDAITGDATHQVVGGPGGVPDSVYTELRVAQGIDDLAPVVDGHVEHGEVVLQLLGVDPFAEREFRRATLPADAERSLLVTLLTEPGSLLLSPATAAALGLVPGDGFELAAGGSTVRATLAGLLPAGRSELDHLAVTDIATAKDWLGMPAQLSRIDARPDGEAEADALAALLPPGLRLLPAAGRSQAIAEMSRAFTTNLTAMSLLALLVGVFLIYNSVSFAVLQRRELLATLRALGLTREQAMRLILGEGIALGIAGSALGLAAGYWLGQELLTLVSRSINDLYFRVSVTNVSLAPLTCAKGIAAGLLATLVASAVPAAEAAAYRPRLGMSRASLEQRTRRLLPRLSLAGIGLCLLALPLLALSRQGLVAGLAALFALVFGLALTIPWCVRRLVDATAPLAARAGGGVARYAVAGIGAELSRTGVAIVALAVAVSATVGVSVMVDSFRGAVGAWLANTLQADLYVAPERGSFAREEAAALARVGGIAAHSSSRRVWLESDTGRTRLVALEMAPGSYAGIDLVDGDAAAAWAAFDTTGAVVVSEPYAWRHGVAPGASVRLATARGERAFPIAGVYRTYDAVPEAVIMSRRIYDMFFEDDRVDGVGLYLADDADATQVAAAVAAAAPDLRLDIRSTAELRARSLEIFDQTFVITDVLYWLAVGVAIVGILGAMLALQLERARELATLRALGLTRAQLGGLLALQSGLIGLFAGLFALPLGLLMAVVLVDVINRRAFGWSMPIDVDPAVPAYALSLAVVAAIVAGAYPAWRAARSRPALAMRED